MKQALLVLIAVMLFSAPVQAQNQGQSSAGQVYKLAGTAEARQETGDVRRLNLRGDVFIADTVLTQEDSTLVVALNDGSSLTLEEGSQLLVSNYVLDPEPSTLLALTKGRLRATVGRAFAGRRNSFQVQTGELIIGVQGTDFSVLALGGLSRVYVYDGLVELRSTDPAFPDPVLLRPGEFAEARLGEPIDPPGNFTGPASASYQASGSSSDYDPRYDPRYYYPPAGNPGIDPCNELGYRSDDYLPDPRRTYIESEARKGNVDPRYGGYANDPNYQGYQPGYAQGGRPAYGRPPGYGPSYGPGYAGAYGPCPRYGTRYPIPENYDDDYAPPGTYPPQGQPQAPDHKDGQDGHPQQDPYPRDGYDKAPDDGGRGSPGYSRPKEDGYQPRLEPDY